mmetsp:Transcript_18312/g.40028  ORF Transcript_18312/g.40028 Transcript_18312/m.40028 type:complete len:245 (-) Transcript_18312:398-1132(-)|eukprot:CAMPEP_0118958554 /NCGR_PEP_ID=MMETSP1169-20130426/62679_1 /TAXON_ID=36882 /ORGANISM="Pyramimonas obovata, Strain CCMP722" /LENGTH=244 /DNA_ID=CAMNT_0006906673 /DNA_START=311 /DNA_END=1045 /DNA_ORIENTATION=-
MWFAYLGFLLIGLGPGTVVFLAGPARKSFLVILTLASAFIWLVSLMVVAILVRGFLPLPSGSPYYAAPLLLGVLVQEITRVGLWRVFKLGTKRLEDMAQRMGCAPLSPADYMSMALATGMGHGFAHSMFFFFGLATLSLGPATYYVDKCPDMSLFLYSALASGAMLMLHSFSMVVAFDGYAKGIFKRQALPPIAHFCAASLTLLNLVEGGCAYVLPGMHMCTVGMLVYAASIFLEVTKAAAPPR